jgi:hypothetical protein
LFQLLWLLYLDFQHESQQYPIWVSTVSFALIALSTTDLECRKALALMGHF